jgi:hypothetical protein
VSKEEKNLEKYQSTTQAVFFKTKKVDFKRKVGYFNEKYFYLHHFSLE